MQFNIITVTNFQEGFRVVQPIYIGKLVAYFTVGSNEEKRNAYVYAGIIVACALVEAIVHHPMFLGVMRAGMHLRIATSALIYRKVSASLVSICIRLSCHNVKKGSTIRCVVHVQYF